MLELIIKDLREHKRKNNVFEGYCYGRACSNCGISNYRKHSNSKFAKEALCEEIWKSIELKKTNKKNYK